MFDKMLNSKYCVSAFWGSYIHIKFKPKCIRSFHIKTTYSQSSIVVLCRANLYLSSSYLVVVLVEVVTD